MISAISRLLHRLGIPPGSGRPAPTRIAMAKGGGGPAPATTIRSDAVGTRDDRGRSGKGVEPAMAGIPRDAVQRTPPVAASPGLPPVDPVKVSAETGGTTPTGNRSSRKVRPSKRQARTDGVERGGPDVAGNLS